MKKWIVVGSVWVVAIASAALLVYKLNHPLVSRNFADAMAARSDLRGQAIEDPANDTEETPVLDIPMATIQGTLRGTAEMQGTDDLIIGPGKVTHRP